MGDNIRLLAENEIWSIYPVPFGNYLEIQLNNPITGRVTIDLFDMSGRKITAVNNTLLPAGWHKLRFDASKLKAGSYLIRLVHAQGTLTQLITKQ
ncbi:MAG: T9SS type A sorting domain-containing protein [Bacteroidales bacterium]|nr:T9SS type A sorting domain-containing protein [Bacteroidales bacterium]